jgi:hypothetical protein
MLPTTSAAASSPSANNFSMYNPTLQQMIQVKNNSNNNNNNEIGSYMANTPTRKISFQLGPTGGLIVSTNSNVNSRAVGNNEFVVTPPPPPSAMPTGFSSGGVYSQGGSNSPVAHPVKVYRTEMTILPSSANQSTAPPHHPQTPGQLNYQQQQQQQQLNNNGSINSNSSPVYSVKKFSNF